VTSILVGDARSRIRCLDAESVRTCVTSPPYFGLRDYGHDGQIGQEQTVAAYVEALVNVFREVRRVLREDGTLWVNLGDSYASPRGGGMQGKNGQRADRRFTPDRMSPKGIGDGLKPKDLIGIPWRVAFALQADGWWLRQDIIWSKPNPMPESVTDRCTRAHEYLFHLSKSERYFHDDAAMAEPTVSSRGSGNGFKRPARRTIGGRGSDSPWSLAKTRNRRSVWTIATRPYKGAHFATFPETLVEPCILAGSEPGDLVLDPFSGTGTTLTVALRHGRRAIGIEINPEYVALARERLGVFGRATPEVAAALSPDSPGGRRTPAHGANRGDRSDTGEGGEPAGGYVL